MKVVIDIDKEEYEECKQYLAEGVFTNWEGIIAQGKPYEERPQGEWEFDGEDILKCSIFKCSVCGERSCCKGNFCPDCGAEMKGGAK